MAIECQVRANPSENIIFEWTTNSTLSPKVPLSFSSSGLKSVAKFVATSEQDYGLVQCWSRNSIGKQLIPCRYQIIKAGTCLCCHLLKRHSWLRDETNENNYSFVFFFLLFYPFFGETEAPSQPHNCSLVNKTANSLTLECLPGHAGGLEQSFHLQVYSLNPHKLLKNLSNAEAPYFAIQNLPAGYIFKMIIYSANRKGKSKSIEITGSTTEPSPWKSGMWAEVACEGV